MLDRTRGVRRLDVALDRGGELPVLLAERVRPGLGALGGQVAQRDLGTGHQRAPARQRDQVAGNGVHGVDPADRAGRGLPYVGGYVVALEQLLQLEPEAGEGGAQHVRGVLGERLLRGQALLELAGRGEQRLADRLRLRDVGTRQVEVEPAAAELFGRPGELTERRRQPSGDHVADQGRDQADQQHQEAQRALVAAGEPVEHGPRLRHGQRTVARVDRRRDRVLGMLVVERLALHDDRRRRPRRRTRAGRTSRRSPRGRRGPPAHRAARAARQRAPASWHRRAAHGSRGCAAGCTRCSCGSTRHRTAATRSGRRTRPSGEHARVTPARLSRTDCPRGGTRLRAPPQPSPGPRRSRASGAAGRW